MKMRTFSAIVLLSVFPLAAIAEDSATWNQWRGPNRDSVLPPGALPEKLSGNLELVWSVPRQASYSGPVTCGDLVITTETVDKKFERVTAYEIETGEEAWTTQWEGSMSVPFFAAANGSWIKSTPACTDSLFVVMGMRDVLVALNPKTGEELWRIDFPATLGNKIPAFGSVCSPIIDNGFVYVQTGGATVKVDADDGGIVWQTLAGGDDMMSGGAFSSPVIATLAGVRQLVVQTRQELTGVDLDTGDVMWRQPIEAFRGMNILTPTIIGDSVFTAAHSGRSHLFDIGKSDAGWMIDERWTQKTQAYMSSPVVIGDAIYLHAKSNRLVSLAVEDGDIRFTGKPAGKYWSMIASGDSLLVLDQNGTLILMKADGGEPTVVDEMKVGDDAWAHLALQDDFIFVRTIDELKAYRF